MRSLLVLFVAVISFGFYGEARAQAEGLATASSVGERAHSLFLASREQMEAGQFAEAVDSLERSMRLQPNVASAFALVLALRGMGDFKAALDRLGALRGGAFGEIPPERDEQLRRLQQSLDDSLATLEIVVCGAATPRVWLDGHLVDLEDECEPHQLRLNPGEHSLSGVADQSLPIRRLVLLSPGEERRLELTFQRDESAVSAAAPWYRSPWVWITVGVLVAGAGAGVAVGVSGDRGPDTSDLPGEVVQALR